MQGRFGSNGVQNGTVHDSLVGSLSSQRSDGSCDDVALLGEMEAMRARQAAAAQAKLLAGCAGSTRISGNSTPCKTEHEENMVNILRRLIAERNDRHVTPPIQERGARPSLLDNDVRRTVMSTSLSVISKCPLARRSPGAP